MTHYWENMQVNEDGKLEVDASLEVGDIEIGAVEIKDGDSDTRASVNAKGSTTAMDIAIVDDAGTQITSFGSPSTIAEYKSPSDFTATYTSSTTITLSGVSFTATSEEIVYIRVIPLSGDAEVYTNGSSNVTMTISGNVITIAGAGTPFTTGDLYEVGINSQKKAYDLDLDVNKDVVQNPEWAHYTSTEHVVDETNVAADTYRIVVNQEGYRNACLQLNGSGGVTFTVWASLDDTADDSADTGWIDISTSILGAASLVDDSGIYFVDTTLMPDRYMFKYVTSDTTNSVDAWFKRY